MEHIKLQAACMLIILYIAFIYHRECKAYKLKTKLFKILLIISAMGVFFDGATAYTVNHLDTVNSTLNRFLHIVFFIFIESIIVLLCAYLLIVTEQLPKKFMNRFWFFFPHCINVIFIIISSKDLEYIEGTVTNYSMGMPAYICYIAVVIYILFMLYIFVKKWNYVEHHKRMSILTTIIVLFGINIVQMIYPEILFTSLGVTITIVGIYINLENPAYKKLSNFTQEVVISFANIIENRDNSTGGHVKRTSLYVKMIANELAKNEKYKNMLTKDYIQYLVNAAPMHDIGKIAVSDAILKKNGKLTDDEYDEIKKHASKGEEIINSTFSHLSDKEYCKMACDVAKHHHEKWNGKGYPDGLKEKEIPLSARIMAVADVFDAISEDRCYRDAMPLTECYKIIEEGKGKDFDPLIVDVFLSNKDKVEEIHRTFKK